MDFRGPTITDCESLYSSPLMITLTSRMLFDPLEMQLPSQIFVSLKQMGNDATDTAP